MTRSRRRAAAVLAGLLGVTLSACHLPRWPVEAPLTSGFGLRFLGVRPDIHRGVDLGVPTGTRVFAMAGGTVRFAGTMSGFGNVIWIDHANGFTSIYAHLSVIDIQTDQRVDAGDPIGASGASGSVTAPHLHFEVWRWGRPVDPITVLGGRPIG